jgi:hypothetical protein
VGVSLQSPFCIPNGSPSQARFNPDEPKLRLMGTNSPESVTLIHWDWTFVVSWCDTKASASVCFFVSFLRKKPHPHLRTWGCQSFCRILAATLGLS